MLRVLFENPLLRVEHDESALLLRVTRTDVAADDAKELRATYRQAVAAYGKLDRSRTTLLLDMRQAKGRNDPEFEKLVRDLTPKLLGGFARVGTLVATAAGALQVQRVTRIGGTPQTVFTDETEALAWARGG